MSFPLYDHLAARIKDPDSKVWPQISKLDKENTEIIFYLILHYARLHGNNEEIPYASRVPEGGKGVIFDVANIPKELQSILCECVKEITN